MLIGVRARELVFGEGVSYWGRKILTFEKNDLLIRADNELISAVYC